MEFRVIFIAGILITSAFFISQGFGETYGIVQEAEEFEQVYPSDTSCDWNQTGTLVNLVTTTGCELNIDDLTSTYADIDLERYPLAETEEEFEGQKSSSTNLQYLNNSLGDYFTKSNLGTNLRYYSDPFYMQTGQLQVQYQYEEVSAPTSANLILWDEGNGNEEQTVTLTPGTESGSYYQTKTLSAANDGQYSLRIEISGATEDEQRVYSLHAWQNSEDVGTVAAGQYESDTVYASDDTNIDRVEILADDIQRGMSVQKQYANVYIDAYDSGQIVDTRTLEASNDLDVYENLFENETVDEFQFQIELVSETGETPEFSSISLSGTTADRVASEEASNLFRIVFLMMLIGLAVVYVASHLPRG